MRNLNITSLERDGAAGHRLDNDFFLYQGDSSDVIPDRDILRLDVLGLCYVQKGIYGISVNGKKYELTAGQLLVCHPNDFFVDVTFSKDFYGLIIFASVDILSGLVDSIRIQRCLEGLSQSPVVVLNSNQRELLDTYGMLFENHRSNDISETTSLIGKSILADIFNHILPSGIIFNSTIKESRSKVIYQQFINLLVSTPEKPHDTEYYAGKLNITPKYLSAICRKESGRTSKEWIHEYIMNDARRYLISSDLSIKEIAMRLGFSNFSFFCRTVRVFFGKTPLEIRNSQRK